MSTSGGRGTAKGLGAGALAVLLAALAVPHPAHAQSTPGTDLTVVLRDGSRTKLHVFGWRGIDAAAIFTRGRDSFARAGVRIVCARECPPDLPAQGVAEDIVAWKTGASSAGRVAVACDEYDRCFVVQGDRRRPWHEVQYIQFAEP
jgi:hypothetical protein